MKLKILFLAFSLVFLNFAYSQEKTLTLKFNHTANGEALIVNKSIFKIANGKAVVLKRAEFYLSGFSLYASETDSMKIIDSYLLVQATDQEKIHTVGNFPSAMNFKKIRVDCGIDKKKNHADPSLYPDSHPLGLKDPSMHWGWAGGYRFMALEGMVDNDGDGVPETDFEFHCLGDDLLYTAVIEMNGEKYTEGQPIVINLDYAKLFNNLTMVGNLIKHGSSVMNKTMLTNAATANFISQGIVSSSENITFDSVGKITQNNRNLTIDFNNGGHTNKVSIYNLFGQLVLSKSSETEKMVLDLNNVLAGNYFISLDANGKKASKQIFIY